MGRLQPTQGRLAIHCLLRFLLNASSSLRLSEPHRALSHPLCFSSLFISVLLVNTSWKTSSLPFICYWEPDLYTFQDWDVLHVSVQELQRDGTDGTRTFDFITLSSHWSGNRKLIERVSDRFYVITVTVLLYFPNGTWRDCVQEGKTGNWVWSYKIAGLNYRTNFI